MKRHNRYMDIIAVLWINAIPDILNYIIQTIQSMSADLEVTNHKLEKLTADNESKDAEIEKTRILRMLTRQADLRDEMNESKVNDK